MAYTIPPDTRAVGTGNPPVDIDDIADVLTGWGTGYSVLNTAWAGGADPTGAADSTAAINGALTAATAGQVVALPAGTFKTTASLVLPADGVTLAGAGMGATVIQPASGNFDVITTPIPASSGTAGYVRNYACVRDLTVNCANLTGTTAGAGNGIHFYGARYCQIRNVMVKSSPNWSVLLDGDATPNFGYNNLIHGCIFDVGAAGMMATSCEANAVIACIFKYATTACAAGQPAFGTRSTYANHLNLTSGYHYVAGNVFGNGGTYTSEAVLLSNAGPARITGNRFDQVRYQAIHATAGPQVITGNQFGNPGSAATGVPAIDIGAGGITVTGNSFDTTNGSAAWSWAIKEEGAYAGCVYEGNRLIAGTSGVVSVNSGSTTVAGHNPGWNPVGKIASPPAVPSSTGTATNSTGVDCTVYITTGSGVTVSAILIGTNAAGPQAIAASTTAPGIRLPAGQTISLTYAGGTPTWTWFGD
jgi:Pectate lyase superfamily protein